DLAAALGDQVLEPREVEPYEVSLFVGLWSHAGPGTVYVAEPRRDQPEPGRAARLAVEAGGAVVLVGDVPAPAGAAWIRVRDADAAAPMVARALRHLQAVAEARRLLDAEPSDWRRVHEGRARLESQPSRWVGQVALPVREEAFRLRRRLLAL